jgi:hypothetical protein
MIALKPNLLNFLNIIKIFKHDYLWILIHYMVAKY